MCWLILLATACPTQTVDRPHRQVQGQRACERFAVAMESCAAEAWPGGAPADWREDCAAVPDTGEFVDCYVIEYDCRRELLDDADCMRPAAAAAAFDEGLASCRDACEG